MLRWRSKIYYTLNIKFFRFCFISVGDSWNDFISFNFHCYGNAANKMTFYEIHKFISNHLHPFIVCAPLRCANIVSCSYQKCFAISEFNDHLKWNNTILDSIHSLIDSSQCIFESNQLNLFLLFYNENGNPQIAKRDVNPNEWMNEWMISSLLWMHMHSVYFNLFYMYLLCCASASAVDVYDDKICWRQCLWQTIKKQCCDAIQFDRIGSTLMIITMNRQQNITKYALCTSTFRMLIKKIFIRICAHVDAITMVSN